MSTGLDETAADVPVRDVSVHLSRLTSAPDAKFHQNARARSDLSRVSREELEDRFLRLHDENLLLKKHNNKQEDKIRKLSTKLMKLVKDRERLEQLAAGRAAPVCRVRDVEMEEMMEELQERGRCLQAENQELKQRLLVARHQLINSQSRRPSQYRNVPSRINTGLKKAAGDSPSPTHTQPKASRALDAGGRPPSGQLPRYGHSLLEEARAEIRNLEKVIESQQRHMDDMKGEAQQMWEELRKKEAEYEERLLQVQQQRTNKLRSQVNENLTMIKLQKQLEERFNTITQLEARFLQLQESQRVLRSSHDSALQKVEDLTTQLKDQRLKNLDLQNQLVSTNTSNSRVEQLQQHISEVEQDRDQLKEENQRMMKSAFDLSEQQKWQVQEQQLKLQVVQLETALKADLEDKNHILERISAERGENEKLREENARLQVQFLEQKQQCEELDQRVQFHSRSDCDEAELTQALLHLKKHKSDLGFLREEAGGGAGSVLELRAVHAETIQELEKTRTILSRETHICNNYKQVELEAVVQKMNVDRVEYEQKLDHQAQLLDTRMMKIRRLEAQLRDSAYGARPQVLRGGVREEEESESGEPLHLEPGQNLVELQIVSAALSPSVLETLGDSEPSTFCTYTFYLSEQHSTPVVTGRAPSYGFTSRYLVAADDGFLRFLRRGSVTVELHQMLGVEWRTLASGQLRPRLLLQQDGKVHGTIPLVASCGDAPPVASVDFWLRLRIPMTENFILDQDQDPDPVTAGPIRPAPREAAEVKGHLQAPKPGRTLRAKGNKVSFVDLPPQVETGQREVRAGDDNEEEEEEPLTFSEGQLRPPTHNFSDDSEISEEIMPDPAAANQDASGSNQSDSDDCVVPAAAARRRKVCERVRVEVCSLSLWAGPPVLIDSSASRLFVEYSFLDLPTEETPLSLPKPAGGGSISFNYSKVFPVDAENNGPRRRLLRDVLRGRHPHMERIRFTVVSEPPEEEELERECEDVGVAFVRIPDILEKRRELLETPLNVVDVVDSSQVVGSLVVSVEALEALKDIMEEQEQDSVTQL